ncbi:hypothetical protein QE408_001302 [Agrobacterium larrymoorei]|uniref:Winged helix-turn helix domain-containing protein n=1 Tax=Agrobacterium larrymoorei TaxID=160699 RepID=A0ABU0UGV7_9HYPH|nr:hypothetical protein [Agrobacterium larrymoorei]
MAKRLWRSVALAPRGIDVHRATVGRFLHRLGLSNKKSLRASEQRKPEIANARDLWISRRKRLFNKALSRLVFINETSTNTRLTRRTGWSIKGSRFAAYAPSGSGRRRPSSPHSMPWPDRAMYRRRSDEQPHLRNLDRDTTRPDTVARRSRHSRNSRFSRGSELFEASIQSPKPSATSSAFSPSQSAEISSRPHAMRPNKCDTLYKVLLLSVIFEAP